MRRSGRLLPRRTPGEWGVRLALAGGVAIAAYFSLTFSMAQIVAGENPGIAHLLAPYDGRITGEFAASLIDEQGAPAQQRRATNLSRHALRQDPTATAAMAALGVDALNGGDETLARRRFAYAQALTRRDLRVQLWAIEDAVGRGDVPAALRQYDIALRTKPALGDVLFPVLAVAMADAPVREQMIRTLADNPSWGDAFLTFVINQPVDAGALASLMIGLRHAGVAVSASVHAAIVYRLVSDKGGQAAWAYYAVVHPGADRRRSRDPHFSARLDQPSQFDWNPISDGGAISAIDNGGFSIAAPASVGGPVLRQVQMLPPGRYRLSGHSSGIQQTGDALPYWLLTCEGSGEIGRLNVPNSAQAGGRFQGTFMVPANCPMQLLTLIARPSEAAGGMSGRIDRAELAPLP